ncbi:MAG: sulfite exporter TauE/SafE family protein [Chloroflexi bacterium]|nr:sulfite exporter TauE/SafE family protein [Chloroflexota bacterium]
MNASVPARPRTQAPAGGILIIPIAGMTCRSCERRIERSVRRIPNVQRASASASRARVEVVTSGPVSGIDLAEAIEAAGYEVGETPWLTPDGDTWLAAGSGLVLIVAVAILAELLGFSGLTAGLGDIREGGLLVAGLLGLAAGVSTCIALTGGLVLALSAAAAAARADDPDPSVATRLRPVATFLAGRVFGFALLGAALGALGSRVVLPPVAIAVLMLIVAVVMTILGVRLTGLSPRIAAWSPTLPSGLGARIGTGGEGSAYTDTRAAALGVASFFLPCGFTQAVQIYALSTGSPLVAGGIMAAFAIGTVPGLLTLGGLPSLLPRASRPAVLQTIGVIVIGFAFLNGVSGLRLAGLLPDFVPASAAAPSVTVASGVQTLRTAQVSNGYEPANVSIYAGIPTRWIIDSRDGGSCAVFLQVPSLGIAVTLQPGENVIDLPALGSGRLQYMCSMGMYGGQLTVVDGQPPVDGTSAGG